MNRESALQVVKSIKQPILVDDDTKRAVQTYKILTSDGLLILECPQRQPIIGTIYITEERLELIMTEALSNGKTLGGRKVLIFPNYLTPEEWLLFMNGKPKPNVNYWAYSMPLGSTCHIRGVLSEDRDALHQEYISDALLGERKEIILWEHLDETSLVEMAELVASGKL